MVDCPTGCIGWNWHLYGDSDDARLFTFQSPNVGEALSLGDSSGNQAECVEDGTIHDAGPAPGPGSNSGPEGTFLNWSEGGFQGSTEDITLSDFGSLVLIEGGDGAPILESVTAISDKTVTLEVSGAGTNGVQYRYWVYSGFEPSEIRVPYFNLSGGVTVDKFGIYSFQVRMVDGDGVLSSGSNVVNELLGMEAMKNIDTSTVPGASDPIPANLSSLLTPNAPPVATPLPVLVSGSRPDAPVISNASQVSGTVGRIEVTMAGTYPGTLEYRWWPHSGFGPTLDYKEWSPASVSGTRFYIDGVLGPVIEGEGAVQLFDFQARVVDSSNVSSDPSDVFILLVWGQP